MQKIRRNNSFHQLFQLKSINDLRRELIVFELDMQVSSKGTVNMKCWLTDITSNNNEMLYLWYLNLSEQ